MVQSPFMDAIRQTVSEFSENTSIHGVRYIAENGRRWVERFLWIVTEVVCVTGAVYMLLYLLSKFQGNPTMTRVESYFHEVADVPFPAITLCNVNRIFRSRARRLVERLKLPETYSLASPDVMRLLPLLGQLLASAEMGTDIAGRVRLERILKYNNLTAAAVLEEVGQPCQELIERCSWEGREVPCVDIFTKTITYLGFCCSFNSQFDFSMPQSSQPGALKRAPLKTTFFGYPLGLTVLLNPHVEDYYWGPFSSGGVVCAVHDSGEMATERTPQAMVSIEKESMVQVMPSIQNASATLRSVTPARRRCLFEDERPDGGDRSAPGPDDDQEYSYESCTVECDASKIWKACSCRPLNFPRLSGSRGTLCDLSKLPCLAKFVDGEHELLAKGQVRGDKMPSSPNEAEMLSEEKFQTCGCLAQCNSVSYELETTTANFAASQWVRRDFYQNINATSRSLLHVFFDSQTSALFINDLVSNTVQLMSSFGGIFSLFLGCSFMSAVEVVYFFTVRLWLLVRGDGSGGAGAATLTPAPAPAIAATISTGTPAGDVLGVGSPRDAVARSWALGARGGDEAWGAAGLGAGHALGWGSDKPTRPRAF